ncbi:MAG: hypothetical protein ABWK05_04895 [Pyrobaculum sp.]
MIAKAVKKILGVEDSPKWLEREVARRMQEQGLDVEGAVGYMAPWLTQIHKANLAKFRPGRAGVRKAAKFLTAELIERAGFGVSFVNIFGDVFPAAVRGGGLYTPVIPLFDDKKKSLYIASKSKKYMQNVIQITTSREVEGVVVDVVRLEKPPYYYLYTEANLARLIENTIPITASVNKKTEKLYYYWRHFRERGYLVLAGREIGGVAADVLAVGLGKYAVVIGEGKRANRLRKILDAVYVVT